ncbi:hypothetical protein DFJ74DRAFT_475108 [Hyaloraphidium curvatum]|nr:hypothetical protein DFJ74DRAFT_475108 [Hyaloraphidium curvatum]
MSFDSGKECVWTDKECCAGYAASADETTPYFECGERYAAAYGGDDGYGEPSSFCNKAFDALGSSSVTAQDAGSPPGLDCERQCLISRIEQANICIRTHSRKFCEREGDRLYQECISKCPLTTGAPPTDAPPTDTASPSDDTQDPCRVCRDLATCKEGEGIDLAKCDKSTGTVHDVCVATAKARYGNCVVGCVAQCGSLLLPEENCLGKYVLVLA